MKRCTLGCLLVLALVFGMSAPGQSADLFSGDTAIYGAGGTVDLRPNVLFVVDNSSFMSQGALGDPYDPSVDYDGDYTRDAVYRRISATGGTINYDNPASPFIDDISEITCTEASSILSQTSYYTGSLQSNGACRGQTGFYYTGNLLNYLTNPPAGAAWQQSHYYNLGEFVQVTDPDTGEILYYEVIGAGNSTGSQPNWGADEIVDGGITWKKAGNVMKMVKDAIETVVEAARDKAKFGLMIFGSNNAGGRVIATVTKMASSDTISSNSIDGDGNYDSFMAAVDSIDYVSGNTDQPINEALWDARLYYGDDYDQTSSRMGTDPGGTDLTTFSTPVECPDIQPNFVVVLTMGNSYSSGAKANTIGDQDAAYNVGDVDDAAKRLYSGDITVTPHTEANPQIATTVIKLINDEPGSATDLTQSALRRAAAYGHGGYHLAQNSSDLAEALFETINGIVLQSDTSFVAPVVPTSPENRTYSGERVYLGFFKPLSKKPWSGNLKKFGINNLNQITDKDDQVATYESGAQKGNFISTAKSFWNDVADAGLVEVGGTGEKFLDSTYDLSSRNIYTYLGTSHDLTNSSNAFSTSNSGIHYDTTLGLTGSADKDKLIDYIYGYDAWDDNGNLVINEKRDWILGDILHSKPMVVNYSQFAFTTSNESSCSVNETMVYVGANDGMLHAFRDCDGSEAWAFIPPDLLGDLKLLPPGLQSQYNPSGVHPYFVDGSPVAYTYDANNDGVIESGDKVILLFGLRRGGSAYYALDVTNPEAPVYLWKIDPDTVTSTGDDFAELGQSWSTPQLANIRLNVGGTVTDKVVAFIGGGYDKEEDSRYGGAYDFPPSPRTEEQGEGYVASTNSVYSFYKSNRPNAKGRALYAFEVATLNSGVPTIPTSPVRIWAYTGSDSTAAATGSENGSARYLLKHGIPSDVTVLDKNYDGYADRLYVGDLGGQVFAFNVSSTDVSQWSGRNIFLDYNGRKIFYRPSVSIEKNGDVLVAFGTGDRAHPLNTHYSNTTEGGGSPTVDSFFMVKDKGQAGILTGMGWSLKRPGNLVDVTEDYLQRDDQSIAGQTYSEILDQLNDPNKYGWYIRLNEWRSGTSLLTKGYGEKVLASPLIFNKVVYFTTYIPNTTLSTDPCTPGNLGASSLYAVNYLTGEAVLNFNTGNDDESTDNNTRALNAAGDVLRRSDRKISLGVGIPSGLVVLMPPSGEAKLLIGCGGGLCNEDPVLGGTIIPIYWMQR